VKRKKERSFMLILPGREKEVGHEKEGGAFSLWVGKKKNISTSVRVEGLEKRKSPVRKKGKKAHYLRRKGQFFLTGGGRTGVGRERDRGKRKKGSSAFSAKGGEKKKGGSYLLPARGFSQGRVGKDTEKREKKKRRKPVSFLSRERKKRS